ncbi:MAG TPA: D-alanyl-D-alanine carboxypeptidase family protein, partial [Rectinemataceae bacterium]|nr:D-alanyl-D-alanine carboxypeptidase family protein [Rectinemataceae bacterium]
MMPASSRPTKLHLAVLLVLAAVAMPAAARSARSPDPLPSIEKSFGVEAPPVTSARSVVILDQATGTVLYAKNPDLVIPPASLTKLITLHLVYEEIKAGRLSKDELVVIDKRDCSPYIPYGSSLMYLRPGMKVSVLDLMKGAAVVSGNDAAFTLARRIAGSNEAFAARMNQAVRALGFHDLHFVEPSGLSELNRATALEYAEFCRIYLSLHPESIAELHSLHYIEFPRAEHATADFKPEGRIIQYNRNNLVLSYDGCDGLKTGYIIESGYNLAATARRGDTRFIVVTLGGSGEGSAGGGAEQRSTDGAALFDWAFASFITLKPEVGPLNPPRVWFGKDLRAAIVPSTPLAITAPLSAVAGLS